MSQTHTWTTREDDVIKFLAERSLSAADVADLLSLAGFPSRDDKAIAVRGRKIGAKFTGNVRRPAA